MCSVALNSYYALLLVSSIAIHRNKDNSTNHSKQCNCFCAECSFKTLSKWQHSGYTKITTGMMNADKNSGDKNPRKKSDSWKH